LRRSGGIDDQPECPKCGHPMVVKSSNRGSFWGCSQFPICRGTRDVEIVARTKRRSSGTRPTDTMSGPSESKPTVVSAVATSDPLIFVQRRSDLRIGKVISEIGDILSIEFVDVPGEVVEIANCSRGEIDEYVLPIGCTIWLPLKVHGFIRATVKAKQEQNQYLVQLWGLEDFQEVPATSVVVRDGSRFHSPCEALKVGLTDDINSYRARIGLVRSNLRQRATYLGFSAIGSSAVRPIKHQLDVLAQVMNDPRRRFVLADEVGLGKTIEAGLISRQILLDDERAVVHFSVPKNLIGQWEQELREKLLLNSELENRWAVFSHEELSKYALEKCDLLVIDEAHQVAELALKNSKRAEIAESAAAHAPGLLLLTATPMRGNAQTFQYLLHLVDPHAYPKGDFDAFESRLNLREEQASDIELLMDSEVPRDIAHEILLEYCDQFPDDEFLRGISGGIGRLTDEQFRITSIRTGKHLRDAYRISRSVIRNRRSDVAGYRTTGRAFERHEISDPAEQAISQFLERWRNSESDRSNREAEFMKLVDASMAGPVALLSVLENFPKVEASDDEWLAIQTVRAQLGEIDCGSRSAEIVRIAAEEWARSGRLVVVTSSFSSVAKDLSKKMSERIGERSVWNYFADPNSGQTVLADISRFLSNEFSGVLITDQVGEEGLNLQLADLLIHADVPLSINRFEQRIGRVDRFGRSLTEMPKRNISITSSLSWEIERDRLHQLVGVTLESVATLQRPLATIETELEQALFKEGTAGFAKIADGLGDRMLSEAREIERIDFLEATSTRRGLSKEQFDRLESLDEDWGDIEEAVDRFTSRKGGIDLTKRKVQEIPGVFEYRKSSDSSLLPRVTPQRQSELAKVVAGRRTFSRPIAERNPGTRIIRFGDPLWDWLSLYASGDECGRARAIWRTSHGVESPQLWFQFDFVIEASVGSKFDTSTANTLQRIADANFAPRSQQYWSDGLSAPGEDFLRQSLLATSPVRPDREIRGPMWESVTDLFPSFIEKVDQATREATQRAKQAIRKDVEDGLLCLESYIEDYSRSSHSEPEISRSKLNLRDDPLDFGLLREAIAEPIIRVYAVGAYVVSGEAWDR
jgi:ATP-dependent helicase HepA